MVPASTSRRNVETIKGRRPSTPRTTTPIMTMSFMAPLLLPAGVRPRMRRCTGCLRGPPLRSGPGPPRAPAPPPGPPLCDPAPAPPAPPPLRRAILRAERAEQLHHLAVELELDQPLTSGIEVGLGARLLHDRAFQRHGLARFEAEEELPDRAHQEALEGQPAEHRAPGEQRLQEQRAEEETRRAQAHEEAEEDPRREEAQEPDARALRVSVAVPPGMALPAMG